MHNIHGSNFFYILRKVFKASVVNPGSQFILEYHLPRVRGLGRIVLNYFLTNF